MFNEDGRASKRYGISRNYCVLFIFSGILLHQVNGVFNILDGRFQNITYDDKDYPINLGECKGHFYNCAGDQCIVSSEECDGKINCALQLNDKSNCNKCKEGFQKCKNGSCIDKTLICNGKKGCVDNCEKVYYCAKTIANCKCGEITIKCTTGRMSVPKNENETTFVLDFSRSSLTQLPTNVFENVKNLKKLFLRDNKIEHLDPDIFQSLPKLILLELGNTSLKQLPSRVFQNTKNLKTLYLGSNKIKKLDEDIFRNLHELDLLDLSRNSIEQLPSRVFESITKLNALYLVENKIKDLDEDPFRNLHELVLLDLRKNALEKLPKRVFEKIKNLRMLHIQDNKIKNLNHEIFRNLNELEILDLSKNSLEQLPPRVFENIKNLRELHLGENKIKNLDGDPFRNLRELVSLDLKKNSLEQLPPRVFENIGNLKNLSLQDNQIGHLYEDTFRNLYKLEFLELQKNKIEDVGENIFDDLTQLKYLQTDEHRFCCLKRNNATCSPPPNQFSSCDDLMANTILKSSIWILGIIAIFANLFVIIFRSGTRNSNLNKVNSFLIKNLALSDLFMGIYLLIIAFADFYYGGKYYMYDFKWRTSWICNFSGFISTFSSELTVFTLTVITINRLFNLTQPYRTQQEEILKIKFLMAVGWVLAAILALLPLPFFNIHYFSNFYGRSGVCLPLHITKEKPNGWKYSVLIFVVLNTISFIVIASSYVFIYWWIKKERTRITSSNSSSYTSMGFRMALLILVDAACWIPIITLSVRSLMGHSLSPSVYAWIAVFILPLNAALNPILYTISSTPTVVKFQRKHSQFIRNLGFRWPCFSKKIEKNNIPLRQARIGDLKFVVENLNVPAQPSRKIPILIARNCAKCGSEQIVALPQS